jgi:hypothetical protein
MQKGNLFCQLSLILQKLFWFMKMLLDIKDNKADFIIELLKNFSFVKTETLTPAKAAFLKDLKGSVEEVTLARQGKIKLQSARSFINEL